MQSEADYSDGAVYCNTRRVATGLRVMALSIKVAPDARLWPRLGGKAIWRINLASKPHTVAE